MLCFSVALVCLGVLVESARFPAATQPPVSRDFYKILGVPRTASTSDIKKKYRELSKKHHPDQGGNKEMFLNIRDAHEILSDKEKRKLYDQYGEAGLDPNFERQHKFNQGFPFFNFPSGGGGPRGGNQQFYFFYGGEPHFHAGRHGFDGGDPFGDSFAHPDHSPQMQDLYADDSPVKSMTSREFERFKEERGWAALVQFYAPESAEAASSKTDYEALATQFENVLPVLAIRCNRDRALCQAYRIQKYPTYVLLMPPRSPSEHLVYSGPNNAKRLKEWLNQKVPLSGTILNGATFEPWLTASTNKSRVLYVTEKTVIPLLIRALSYEFEHRISFGFLLLSSPSGKILLRDELSSWSRNAAPSYPAFLHVTDVDSVTGDWIPVGKSDKDLLSLKLSRISVQARSRQGRVRTFQELRRRQYVSGDCNPSEKKMCIFLVLMGDLTAAECPLRKALEDVAEGYAHDPVKFFWLNANTNNHFVSTAFKLMYPKSCLSKRLCFSNRDTTTCSSSHDDNAGDDASDCMHVVAYHPWRKKYKIFHLAPGQSIISQIRAAIENVLSGSALPHQVQHPLPDLV